MKNYNTPHIFVVEDDTFYSSLLMQHLSSNKLWNVDVYNSGTECLNNVYKMPDIVLLDYKLGDMKGIEILKQIKSINSNIEVIFISAQEKLNVAIEALKYGAYDYVEKNDATLRRIIKLIGNITKSHGIIRDKKTWKKERKILVAGITIVLAGIYIGLKYSGYFH